jgi:tetratricopeptide (TPR) repeat protein
MRYGRRTAIALIVLAGLVPACRRAPQDRSAIYLATLRARAQLESGNIKSACKVLRQLARDHDDAIAWANLGVAEERRGKLEAAERAWSAAARRDPHDARAHFLLAQLRLRGAQAARDASRARPQDADKWNTRASALLDSAQGSMQRAVAAAPGEAAVHALAAAVARARGDSAAASRAQTAARRLDPIAAGARTDRFARIILPAVPRESASGQQPFYFESTALPVRGTSLAAADVNGDGRRDLIVLGTGTALVNDTLNAGVVWRVQELLPHADIQVAVEAPWDAGSRADVLLFARERANPTLVNAMPGVRAHLWRADGRAPEMVGELPGAVRRACKLDLDRDGDLDVAIATAGAPGLRLWRNDGSGRFSDVTPAAWASLGGMVDVVGADLDADHAPDLVCAESGGRIRYLAQRPDFSWVDLSTVAGLGLQRGRALALLDVEPDGTLDLVIGNEEGLWVLANRGGGRFARAAAYRVPATNWWPGRSEDAAVGAIAIADCDADGRLDLTTLHPARDVAPVVVAAIEAANPTEDAAPPPIPFDADVVSNLRVWRADPSGVFLDATARLALDVRTTRAAPPVWSDFDLDGDADLAVTGADSVGQVWWNRGENAHRIVRIAWTRGRAPAIGARLLVCAAGVVQDVMVNTLPVEIGVGRATRLDALAVTWPDGTTETRFDLPLPDGVLRLEGKRD